MPDRPSPRRGATAGSLAIDGGVRVALGRPAAFDRDRALRLLGRGRAGPRRRPGARRSPATGSSSGGCCCATSPRTPAAARPSRSRSTAACERCGAEHGRPRLRWPDAAGPAPVGRPGLVRRAGGRRARPAGRRGRHRRGAAAGGDDPSAEAERRDAVAQLLGGPRRTAIRALGARRGRAEGRRPRPARRTRPRCVFDGDRARLRRPGRRRSGSSIAGSTAASSASPSRAAVPPPVTGRRRPAAPAAPGGRATPRRTRAKSRPRARGDERR